MSQPLDAAALQEASAVLQRLAARVEDGAMTDDDDTAPVLAASWRGAAEALAELARPTTSASGS